MAPVQSKPLMSIARPPCAPGPRRKLPTLSGSFGLVSSARHLVTRAPASVLIVFRLPRIAGLVGSVPLTVLPAARSSICFWAPMPGLQMTKPSGTPSMTHCAYSALVAGALAIQSATGSAAAGAGAGVAASATSASSCGARLLRAERVEQALRVAALVRLGDVLQRLAGEHRRDGAVARGLLQPGDHVHRRGRRGRRLALLRFAFALGPPSRHGRTLPARHQWVGIIPPSITKSAPVTFPARSLASSTTRSATSDGLR